MEHEFLEQGGQYDVERTGPDTYKLSIELPMDPDGMIARECPSENCLPAYFKVKPGTGVIGQTEAFCPYCFQKAEPGNFATTTQADYMEQIGMREALGGVDRMVKNALDLDSSGRKKIEGGLLSIEISYDPGPLPPLWHPLGEELRRDLICPKCGLEHAVFGIAVWCPDCGSDIFLQHVSKEYDVVKLMLSDVDNRRERLGSRVAARDIENALEDTVSIFEAVLRAMTRRRLLLHLPPVDVEEVLKKIGNKYQSISLAAETALKELDLPLFETLNDDEIKTLRVTFEKRHPITHNLGIVDRKYLEKVQSGEPEGREVRVAARDVLHAIDLCFKVITDVYPKVFPSNKV